MPVNNVVHIKTIPEQVSLSPAQKKFNTLIKKIDAQKTILREWQETLEQCRETAIEKLEPLRTTLHGHQADLVLLLDRQFTSHKFTPSQADKLTHLITETCEELITFNQRDDLKAIFNKYSTEDFDALDQASDAIALDMMKAMFEEKFGTSLDDTEFDIKDPQGTAERLSKKFKEQQTHAEEEAQKRSPPRKSAKQIAKEAKEAEEAANVSKSIQTVYRQLTSALHPDREQDPVERERKTELMQQVTVAYASKDLLKLLALQLAVEQIDQSKLNNINAERLKHYNQILNNQLRELQEEVLLKESEIRRMINAPHAEPLSPKRMIGLVKQDLRTVQNMIARIQHDMRAFRDVKQLKEWLKHYQIPEPDFDEILGGFPPFR
ncbi:molecular chaperone DnaJ [Thiothrix lacustris]|uniref:molecular chaperone DnaJ n=1 Tax=Thiothrix lacustris TaxID=525917 RepID=UPI0027E43FB1|nr:molecular chaperone DnaJ [Thiothrix lacustris]WMP16642.1 molecular chaperone DnaJ [Thiothrix lacustris]